MQKEDIFETGLTETLKYIKKLELEFQNAAHDTVKDFTTKGLEIINEKANMLVQPHEDVSGEEALNNIGNVLSLGKEVSTARIENNNERAAFIEFGTGMVGMNQPHPTPNVVNWEYYKESIYKKEYEGKLGWWYGSKFREGIPSMPFMYMGSIEIEKQIKEWFGKNLDRRVKQ